MQGETKGRWMELAEQAANEQNPAKLLKLIEGINRMLQAKKNRLQGTKKLSWTHASTDFELCPPK